MLIKYIFCNPFVGVGVAHVWYFIKAMDAVVPVEWLSPGSLSTTQNGEALIWPRWTEGN